MCIGNADAPSNTTSSETRAYLESASGLRYLDERLGRSDAPAAGAGQAVRIRFSGRLLSGASRSVGAGRLAVWEVEEKEVTLGLGSGGENGIWDEGLAGMRVGGRRRILVPPAARARRPRHRRPTPSMRRRQLDDGALSVPFH